MSRNEKTSKAVATKAGKLLASNRRVLALIDQLYDEFENQRKLVVSVAGSALTQAPPRKR